MIPVMAPRLHTALGMELAVFSLASGADLAASVCARLGVSCGRHEEREFEDGEHKIRPLENVRDRDVYVLQSLYADADMGIDAKLCRTLFLLGALRDAGAGRLTAVFPYLCYARKDRRTKSRDPVTTRYVAELFEAMGVDRVVTVDVHNQAAFENAFRVPTLHLSAAPLFAEWFADRLASGLGDDELVVVSPDTGGAKRAERFRQTLEHRLGRGIGSAFLEKVRSEGVVRGGAIVGDVAGRTAIIIDDLVASGGTLARAAARCRRHGARAVYAAATHGIFVGDAERALGGPELERIVILDTLPPYRLDAKFREARVVVLDAAPLLAEAIRCLHGDESTAELIEP